MMSLISPFECFEPSVPESSSSTISISLTDTFLRCFDLRDDFCCSGLDSFSKEPAGLAGLLLLLLEASGSGFSGKPSTSSSSERDTTASRLLVLSRRLPTGVFEDDLPSF